MTGLTLANARLILPDAVVHGCLTVENGRIAAIDPGATVPAGAIDCDGDHVAPGLVELHTDNLERHMRPRPAVEWPHAAAFLAHDGELASTGITTVFDALRVGSIPAEGPEYGPYARPLATEINALVAAGATRISHFLHLRAEICSETLTAELDEFGPDDRVRLVSLMDHTPGQRQFRDVARLAQFVQGKSGMSDADFAAHVARLVEIRARHGSAHEGAAVAAAARFGAALASHDDTTRAHVANSAELGVKLAEFPTTLDAAIACRDHAIAVMMGAPNLMRGGSHSGNVAARDLVDNGLLDILSSDYIPGSLLLGTCRLAQIWGDTARAFATATGTPAAAVGLTDRGRLQVGLRADLLRITDAATTPRVRGVWVQGRQVG